MRFSSKQIIKTASHQLAGAHWQTPRHIYITGPKTSMRKLTCLTRTPQAVVSWANGSILTTAAASCYFGLRGCPLGFISKAINKWRLSKIVDSKQARLFHGGSSTPGPRRLGGCTRLRALLLQYQRRCSARFSDKSRLLQMNASRLDNAPALPDHRHLFYLLPLRRCSVRLAASHDLIKAKRQLPCIATCLRLWSNMAL